MKTAYFDCSSGISGDMCLGALVDAGAGFRHIESELGKLPFDGYTLSRKKVLRAGISATKVDVRVRERRAEGRKWTDIEKIIADSSLPEDIKRQGRAVFKMLFAAEAKVHGLSHKKVHLHELGAVDCMVDIFGTLIGLRHLGVERVFASAVNVGRGSARTSHGILPVPAPATAEILRGVPLYSSGDPFELTTPTGAVLLKSLAKSFGDMPPFTLECVGVGAGGRDLENRPNVLRILIGNMDDALIKDRIAVIETNIDDMNPQVYEYLFSRLLAQGALDVFLTQVIMKKMRPGVKLTVLCETADRDELASIILSETTSIGLRYHETSRIKSSRKILEVMTGYGKIRVKVSSFGGLTLYMPEYDDCRRKAEESGVALIEVMEEAKRAAFRYF